MPDRPAATITTTNNNKNKYESNFFLIMLNFMTAI